MSDSTFNAERTTLLTYLNAQREHVSGILEGLDDESMRRRVLPSGWSCVGVLQHLTLDVERFWFRCIVGGDESGFAALQMLGDAWDVDPELSPAAVLSSYREEISASNDVLVNIDLDSPPAFWPDDIFGTWRLHSNRQVLLHVITETACHAGHLDVCRELIDGRQWMVQG